MRDFDFRTYLGVALNLLVIGTILSLTAYFIFPWRSFWFFGAIFALSLIWSAFPKAVSMALVGAVFWLPVMAIVLLVISVISIIAMILVCLVTIGLPIGIGVGVYLLLVRWLGIPVVAILIGATVTSAILIGIQVWTIIRKSWDRVSGWWSTTLENASSFWWDNVCDRVVSLLTFFLRHGLDDKT